MRWHDGEPIQKQSRQRNFVPLCCLCGQVTEPGFCECQNDIRLKAANTIIQPTMGKDWHHQVPVIRKPFQKLWAKPRFSEALKRIGELQQCHSQIRIPCLWGIGRDAKFKWSPLDQMSVHHDPNAAVVLWRNDADEENAGFVLNHCADLMENTERLNPEMNHGSHLKDTDGRET